jgi:hypothetical protein
VKSDERHNLSTLAEAVLHSPLLRVSRRRRTKAINAGTRGLISGWKNSRNRHAMLCNDKQQDLVRQEVYNESSASVSVQGRLGSKVLS